MNSLILQQQEEVIALAQFDIKDAVLKKCILKEDETVIAVPDGVTTIGKDALCGLQSVIAVTLPESLKVINDGAFYGCSSLTSVTLPDGVERFGSCAICIVHNYDEALGKRRIRDYDNIETKRYLDVIESMLLTNDSGLLCTVLQATKVSERDCTEFYLMRPETLSTWAKNHIKSTTNSCFE